MTRSKDRDPKTTIDVFGFVYFVSSFFAVPFVLPFVCLNFHRFPTTTTRPLQRNKEPKHWVGAHVSCAEVGEGEIVKYHPATAEAPACYEIELDQRLLLPKTSSDRPEKATTLVRVPATSVGSGAIRLTDRSLVTTPYGIGIVAGLSDYSSSSDVLYKVSLDWRDSSNRTVAYLHSESVVPSSFDGLFRSVRRVLMRAASSSSTTGSIVVLPSASQVDEFVLRGSGLLSSVLSSSKHAFGDSRESLEKWIENSPLSLRVHIESSGIKQIALQYLQLIHQTYQSFVKVQM
jgi:hypothetical protein